METIFSMIKFCDDDVINLEDWDDDTKPYLIHEHGFCICVVFAEDVDNALEIAAYDDQLDQFKVTEPDELADDDYAETLTCLGYNSDLYDLSNVDVMVLPNPKRSFVAQFVANRANRG